MVSGCVCRRLPKVREYANISLLSYLLGIHSSRLYCASCRSSLCSSARELTLENELLVLVRLFSLLLHRRYLLSPRDPLPASFGSHRWPVRHHRSIRKCLDCRRRSRCRPGPPTRRSRRQSSLLNELFESTISSRVSTKWTAEILYDLCRDGSITLKSICILGAHPQLPPLRRPRLPVPHLCNSTRAPAMEFLFCRCGHCSSWFILWGSDCTWALGSHRGPYLRHFDTTEWRTERTGAHPA